MIIGYDAKRLFHNQTGLGYYSRTLLTSLHDANPSFNAVLFEANPIHNELTSSYFKEDRYQIKKLNRPAWYHRSVNMNRAIAGSKIQVFHGLSNELPYQKLKTNIPTVVTMHDVLFKSFPEDFPMVDRMIYQFKTSTALKRADMIIAISEATKKELLHYFPMDDHKIKVIYQGYDPIFNRIVDQAQIVSFRKEYHIPEQYLLYVGSITYRKNLLIILKALRLLPDTERIPLVVAGKGAQYFQKVKEYIHQYHLGRWVKFLPNLPRKDLPILYAGAEVLIYPSLGEGFGLPVLEGIAANVPVITSNQSSLPEAGGDIAIYFDPKQPEELAHKISTINKHEVQSLSATKRKAHLNKFDAYSIARQYFGSYELVSYEL